MSHSLGEVGKKYGPIVAVILALSCERGPTTPDGLVVRCPQGVLTLGGSMTCQAFAGPRDMSMSATWAGDGQHLTVNGPRVTARTSGQSSITVSWQGHTSSYSVRTYPDYAAHPWPLRATIVSCREAMSLTGICAGMPVGRVDTFTANFAQAGDTVTAELGGYGLPLTRVMAKIELDGTVAFTVSGVVGPLSQIQQWRLNSVDGLTITGAVTVTWHDPQTADSAEVRFIVAS